MEFKTSHCFLTEFGGLAPAEEVAAEAAVYGCICAFRRVYG